MSCFKFKVLISITLSYIAVREEGRVAVELQDVLRVAAVGLIVALLHIFFEQTGKKEFSFFLFFIAYLYMTIELIRFLQLFFDELAQFLKWLSFSI